VVWLGSFLAALLFMMRLDPGDACWCLPPEEVFLCHPSY
jgi:hypothetical protein